MKHIFEAVAHLFHPRKSNNHRPKILHPEGFALLVGMTMVFSGVAHVWMRSPSLHGDVLGFSSSITSDKVVTLTNKEREKLGLSPLTFNTTLSKAAAGKAANMFEEQYWAHFSPSGKTPWDFIKGAGYSYSVAGENLARDFLETDQMMKAWMNSPSHRENIVNPKYKDIGIAVVNGTLNGVETTLVVQMFGSNTAVAAAPKIDAKAEQTQTAKGITAVDQFMPPVQNQAQEIAPKTLPPNAAPQEVLATSVIDAPNSHSDSTLISPLQLSKAFFLAITILVLCVLVYDTMIIENRNTVRFVGKNAAHIALFLVVFFLILFFKSGVII